MQIYINYKCTNYRLCPIITIIYFCYFFGRQTGKATYQILITNMNHLRWIIPLVLIVQRSTASPFVLTEQYVEDFKKGIDDLKKVSNEYKFEEGRFDPALYNETESLKGTKYILKNLIRYVSSLSFPLQMRKSTTSS